MPISAKDVMSLRQRTGVGMMECKAALNEADGDMDKAVELLREKLKGKMDERSDREAAEGVVAIATTDGAAAMIELLSETDFAARNDNFVAGADKIARLALACPDGDVNATDEMTALIDELRITIKENISLGNAVRLSAPVVGSYVHHNHQLGALVTGEGDLSAELLTGLCQHIAAAVPPMMPSPLAVDEASLPADAVANQKEAFAEEARASGKPENIIEKMIAGKVRKWIDENTLLGQTYIRELDAKKPIRDYLPDGSKITGFVRFALGK